MWHNLDIFWLSRMPEGVGHTKDYTTFTRFVSEAPWSRQELEVDWQDYLNRHTRRALASLQRRAKGKEVPVYLLSDDTLNPKRMAWMDATIPIVKNRSLMAMVWSALCWSLATWFCPGPLPCTRKKLIAWREGHAFLLQV